MATSAARNDDAHHNTARHATGRRPRRPLPGRHTAIAPSGDSHDDRNAAAANETGAEVGAGGGEGTVVRRTYRFESRKRRVSYLN